MNMFHQFFISVSWLCAEPSDTTMASLSRRSEILPDDSVDKYEDSLSVKAHRFTSLICELSISS